MNRAHMLTMACLEGEASPDDEAQLTSLVATDPEARAVHLGVLELESLLRGEARRPSIVDSVIAEVRAPVARRLSGPATRGFVAAAMASVVGLVGWQVLRDRGEQARNGDGSGPLARVVRARGEVRLQRGLAWRPANAGDELGAGDGLMVADPGSVGLAYLGGSELQLGAGSRAWLRGGQGDAHVLVLDRGRLDARIERQPAGRVLTFATPQGRATVLGTRFSLTVTDGRTRLDVQEGLVLFERIAEGTIAYVRAGEHADARSAGVPDAEAAADAALAPFDPPDTFIRFDFEDGVLPDVFVHGQLDVGPPRAGSSHCLLGVFSPFGWSVNVIAFKPPEPVAYSEDLTFGFDYWLGDSTNLIISINGDRDNFQMNVEDAVRGRWTHGEVRLRDFVLRKDGRHLRPGEPVTQVGILGGNIGGKGFYVDNLEVRVLPAAKVPRTTARLPLQE